MVFHHTLRQLVRHPPPFVQIPIKRPYILPLRIFNPLRLPRRRERRMFYREYKHSPRLQRSIYLPHHPRQILHIMQRQRAKHYIKRPRHQSQCLQIRPEVRDPNILPARLRFREHIRGHVDARDHGALLACPLAVLPIPAPEVYEACTGGWGDVRAQGWPLGHPFGGDTEEGA